MMATTDTGLLLDQLQDQREEYTKALLSANSRRGYLYGWAAFTRWAESMDFPSLPATTETLALFVTAQIRDGLKVATAAHRVAAVRRMHLSSGHPSPATAEIGDLLRGARRVKNEQVRQALPLSVAHLRSIALVLVADDTPVSIRNWAMMLIGFCGALRASSIAALLLSDIEFVEQGAILKIRREKNDQEGVGRLIGVPHGKHPETCAVHALRKWIERRGGFPGPLFTRFDGHSPKNRALQPERIGQIAQECFSRIGLDRKGYSGHSLRAGWVTASGTAGAGLLVIAAQTGHRDMATLQKYFRKQDAFAANPCSLLDL